MITIEKKHWLSKYFRLHVAYLSFILCCKYTRPITLCVPIVEETTFLQLILVNEVL